jgi:hypothetical protein
MERAGNRASGDLSSRPAVGPPAANDADSLGDVPLLRRPPALWLREGATRVRRANETAKRDELWQGDGYSMSDGQVDDVPLYFRMADRFTVVAELASSVIARALGLPTPQPYLLNIGAGVLSDSRFATHGKASVCPATADMGGDTFAQLLREDSEYAKKLLGSWKHLVPAVAFDEWLANLDRNFGNILFVAQHLWLIDHAESFGGSQRKLFPLEELASVPFENKLAKVLRTDNLTLRQQWLEQAREWLTFTAGALDVSQLGVHTEMHQWHSEQEETELVDFVKRRLLVTHQLLCQRLGLQQLNLLPSER